MSRKLIALVGIAASFVLAGCASTQGHHGHKHVAGSDCCAPDAKKAAAPMKSGDSCCAPKVR